MRLYGALLQALETRADPVTLGRMCLELITLSLKVTALLDDVPFDPRKRPFVSGTAGPLGAGLREQFGLLLAMAGDVAGLHEDYSTFAFSDHARALFSMLETAALSQGVSFD